MDALEKRDQVFIHDLIPRWTRCKSSDYKAFRRAAGKLREAGIIVLRQGWKDDKPGWINDNGSWRRNEGAWFGEYASKAQPGDRSPETRPQTDLVEDIKKIMQEHGMNK